MPRRDADTQSEAAMATSSLAELGRSLRRARVSQGLAVQDAARMAAVSGDDIDALEGGRLNLLPDQVHTVNLLRRYADCLGLPADRYALALLDAWPAVAVGRALTPPIGRLSDTAHNGTHRATSTLHGAGEAPILTPATGEHPDLDPARTGIIPVPEPGFAPGDTGQIPRQPSGMTPAAAVNEPRWPPRTEVHYGGAGSGPVPDPVGAPGPPYHQGHGALMVLRALVALALVLVLAGAAALAIHHWRPQWLRSLQRRPAAAGPESTGGPAGGRSSTGGTGGTGGSTGGTGGTTGGTVASAPVPSSSEGATITVYATGAQVRVSVNSGLSWVQVTSANGSTIFASNIGTGGQQTFPLQSSLQVQVGSSAARLDVLVNHKTARSYTPSSAPYVYTFQQG